MILGTCMHICQKFRGCNLYQALVLTSLCKLLLYTQLCSFKTENTYLGCTKKCLMIICKQHFINKKFQMELQFALLWAIF